MRFAIVILSLFAFGSFAYAQGIDGPQPTLPQSPLAIDTLEKSHHFIIELADDRFEQQRGLMFRQSVLPDEGMLFDFNVDLERAFWMRNTLISLDMLCSSWLGGARPSLALPPATRRAIRFLETTS